MMETFLIWFMIISGLLIFLVPKEFSILPCIVFITTTLFAIYYLHRYE